MDEGFIESTAESYYKTAEDYYYKGDYERAKENYRQALYFASDSEEREDIKLSIESCDDHIRDSREAEAKKLFENGLISYRNQCYDSAKYYFNQAYDKTYDPELMEEIREYIKECQDALDV